MSSESNPENYVTIGKIRRTFGTEGWLSVEPYTDYPERFQDLTRVYLAKSPDEKFPLPLAIQEVDFVNGRIVLAFTGISDARSAEGLVDWFLLIPEEERYQLPEDRYYIDDLIGLEVVSSDGSRLGSVKSVITNPGNDLLVIFKDSSGTEVLLPMVKAFVKKINLKKQQVEVVIPPGLEEI